MPWDVLMCSSLLANLHPSGLPQLHCLVWLTTESNRSGELTRLVVTEGWRLPADSPPAGIHTRMRRPQGLFVVGLLPARQLLYTYTHRKRLGSLLDDEPLDNMCEDLGLHNGLWQLVLPILWRAARHSGCFILISWGHGWRWGLWWSIGLLGWSPSWAINEDTFEGNEILVRC